MKSSWNTGCTKENHLSLKKTSETMKSRKLDNFKKWRDEQKRIGRIKLTYAPLRLSKELAELIGVILGDGHIGVHPRTESLRIVGNSNNVGFVARYAKLIQIVFGKSAHIAKRKTSNAVNLTIYEKHISGRLKIPSGSRAHSRLPVPRWILNDSEYVRAYLRGLYEAEGSYSVHEGTYTHKFIFSNNNKSLLKNVFRLVKSLGFHPHESTNKVQVSRKEEVQKLRNLLEFRRY